MDTYLGYIRTNPTAPAFTPVIYTSAALRASHVVANNPKNRFNLTLATGFNGTATDRFLQFFETAAVPGAGSIPQYVMPIPARALFSWAPSQGGRVFTKLCYAVSTTAATYTVSGDTVWIDIEGGV